MYRRQIEEAVQRRMFQGKVIVILGARQVGKTTLLAEVTREYRDAGDVLWFNGDEADTREVLSQGSFAALRPYLGREQVIVVDEAQRIPGIGLILKILIENLPERQILVSGSSSWALQSEVNEPLTGRKYQFNLYPFSLGEVVRETSLLQEKKLLEHRLVYGYYPEVVTSPGDEREILTLLGESYLYKDIFALESIRKPALFERLLQALALQLGSEVHYHELGQLVGCDKETVEKYIDILAKAFVVYRLPSLARNRRNELKKGKKIYFWDLGIRNGIIKNFNPPDLRQDVGGLWENFLLSERLKRNQYGGEAANVFFWRNRGQQEVDYVEESRGRLRAYEFKWNSHKPPRPPRAFLEGYPEAEFTGVTRQNFHQFLL